MHPELFEIPFIHVTVKSYGTMMVIGFLCAVWIMRKLMRTMDQNPDFITNVGLYALISGVIGARIFYVIHHHSDFEGFLDTLAVWNGGLEYLGGVITAIIVVVVYLYYNKLPIALYLDVLSVGLLLALGFGRIGCLMFGCCYGKPTECPVAIHFPYKSPAFISQVYPDPARGRSEPQLDLPVEYFGFYNEAGQWIQADKGNKFQAGLKPKELLTEEQLYEVTKGKYRALGIHPTQIYSSINAFILFGILLLFWKKVGRHRPGYTIGVMFILYGITRFILEALRDDNPFEKAWWMLYKGGTISQNLGIYMVIIGVALMIYLKATSRKSKS